MIGRHGKVNVREFNIIDYYGCGEQQLVPYSGTDVPGSLDGALF